MTVPWPNWRSIWDSVPCRAASRAWVVLVWSDMRVGSFSERERTTVGATADGFEARSRRRAGSTRLCDLTVKVARGRRPGWRLEADPGDRLVGRAPARES